MREGSVLAGLETPAVLLDLAQLETNLVAMQDLALKHGVALRPHAKTHKSIEIGARQLALGACGLTVATVGEALVFLQGGVKSITISRPILSPGAFERLFGEVAFGEAQLNIVVDSAAGIEVAAVKAAEAGARLGVFVKVDVGLHRCGVDPDGPLAVELAQQIERAARLEFRGILSHAGQAYAVSSRQEAAAIAEEERHLMLGVRDKLVGQGIEVSEVSVGSTPTVLAANSFAGITEIRPGNYVFLDLLPINVGVVREENVAFSVLATVISKNEAYFVTDAGSKTLTSDAGVHGMSSASGYGAAYPCEHFLSPQHRLEVAGLSEEHGKLVRGDFDMAVGTKVRIIPNHSCPVANLARQFEVIDGEQIHSWPVDAGLCSK